MDFDARDVVGVCSIGQTTKRKDQIGFFGVGFKSVYEVTDRPQIFSDVYQFEIADVSIPKVLRQRPTDLPAGGTLLILPLVKAEDPVRSPAAMFKKAQAIDSYVLMTLKSMDKLDFTLTKAAGGPRRPPSTPERGRRAGPPRTPHAPWCRKARQIVVLARSTCLE